MIDNELKINEYTAHQIVDLKMRKVCKKIVPKTIYDAKKADRNSVGRSA
jgi:hypothetical protein